ncbi:general substrate transporter [Lipomyces mesembrius]
MKEKRLQEADDKLRKAKRATDYKNKALRELKSRGVQALSMHIFEQLTGSNLLDYYILYIYQSLRVVDVRLAAFGQYAIKVVMTLPAILWSDKWGRRPILIIGALSMAICYFAVTGLFHDFAKPNPVLDQPEGWVIIGHRTVTILIQVFLYLSTAAFNFSWAPVTWIYSTEIVPLRIRAKTVLITLTFRWMINFTLGFAMPPLVRASLWGVFMMFGVLNIGASVLVLGAAPETKQRTLEEMDEIFEHGRPLWMSFLVRKESARLDTTAHHIEPGNLMSASGHSVL